VSTQTASETLLVGAPARLQADKRAAIIVSLLTVYIIWGTTYLAIRYALESFPPYLLMGTRFTLAGGGLFVYLRLRGAPMPTRKQWLSGIVIGVLLLVFGMGSVAVAEESISSGLAAMLVATSPVWTLLIGMLWKKYPTRLEWVGVIVGLVGAGILALDGNLAANPVGVGLVLFATVAWSLGSVLSNHIEMAPGMMGNATEMLCGGVILIALGLLSGQRVAAAPTSAALIAIAYLTVFGSLATMTAYMFLLKNVSHSLASSYAFVNPAIALLLGVVVGGEPLSVGAVIALPVILVGVAFVAFGRRSA
jgi:drug/metabolite transporter (DMT)-like permease